MRWLRITGWSVLAIGLVAIAGAVALTQFVDPNGFRGDIERAVRNATGRELRIRGDLGLTWFPWLAVTLRDSEIVGPQGLAAPVSWREARVGARLWPLIRGQLEIDRISVAGLKLQLQRDASGAANWTPSSSPAAAANSEQRPLRIAGLDLIDAEITYQDLTKDSRWQFCGFNLKTSEVSLDNPIRAEGSMRWMRNPAPNCERSQSDPTAVPVEFGGLFASTTKGFEVREVSLRHATAGLELRAPKMTADIAAQDYRVPQWTLSGTHLAATGGPLMLAAKDGVALSTAVDIANANPRAIATALGLPLPAAVEATTFGSLQGRLSLQSGPTGWELRSDQLKLDATSLTGWVRSGANGTVEFQWQADTLKLDGYLPPRDPAAAPFQFPRETLRTLQARGRLAVRKLQWLDVTAHDALLVLELRDGQLRAVEPAP